MTLLFVAAVALAATAAGWWAWGRRSDGSAVSTATTSNPGHSISSASSGGLSAPRTSVADDGRFLADVTEADPSLVSYEQKGGSVATRTLLTDGSAFCAFLSRDRSLDAAMLSLAVGARQVESQTHLPLSVTTFNAVDAVALLTLCPSLEKMVPSSDVARIRELGASLEAESK